MIKPFLIATSAIALSANVVTAYTLNVSIKGIDAVPNPISLKQFTGNPQLSGTYQLLGNPLSGNYNGNLSFVNDTKFSLEEIIVTSNTVKLDRFGQIDKENSLVFDKFTSTIFPSVNTSLIVGKFFNGNILPSQYYQGNTLFSGTQIPVQYSLSFKLKEAPEGNLAVSLCLFTGLFTMLTKFNKKVN